MTKSVIELNDIWVSYPDQKHSLKTLFKPDKSVFWALKGIDFEVKKGEVLGIIGRNGSGKSTLLKLFSGLISPDKGSYVLNGDQRPVLLSLGTGFQSELSGIENIYLNGLLLGQKKQDIDKRLEEIIEFSELGDFVYKPVRTYSSGMKSRLAFSIAITLDPEILLIDEVLGVGDAAFQKKCKDVILQKIKEERTVILVAHSSSLVKSLCDRVVWIHQGEQKAVGDTKEIVKEYDLFMAGKK
ncbi:ABC transporter ATP-binding protein [Metabacillus halosaccharovorans]|uniref:ABC transporter ATP-binding protein n=1 Tax=Metabacillus halosaccharovorans TaxID=930124 RepID=UPI0020401D14|nr:ABC transporter ATP-binding protein [Metabacillus halosaccharovorans]MCM3443790.1 ABC transporter ATP-binding protein [Metabacillus halosaccharovorans]